MRILRWGRVVWCDCARRLAQPQHDAGGFACKLGAGGAPEGLPSSACRRARKLSAQAV